MGLKNKTRTMTEADYYEGATKDYKVVLWKDLLKEFDKTANQLKDEGQFDPFIKEFRKRLLQ